MSSRYGHNRTNSPYASASSSTSGAPRAHNPYSSYSGYGYDRSSHSTSPAYGVGEGGVVGGYRSATPNKKGQYSAQVLEELESQNEERVEGLSAKVRMLKDITVAIGDEVRSSTSLMETMNDQFEGTRRKLKGTMNRMLVMAQKTGVGWKIWLAFIIAVGFLFFWVWI